MDSKNLVKKQLLLGKIKEYFTKHPDRKVGVFSADAGDKTYWKVVREARGFNVTQVKTVKEEFSFILEDDKTNIGRPGAMKDEPTSARGAAPMPYDKSSDLKTRRLAKLHGKAGTQVIQNPGKPQPMDEPQAQPKVDPAKVKAYDDETRRMLSWNVGNLGTPDKEVSKAFQNVQKQLPNQTFAAQLGALAKAMPPWAFKINFGYLHVQKPDDLVNNPKLLSKAVQDLAHQNPWVQNLLRKSGAKSPVMASAKHESKKITEASPEFAQISKDFMDSMGGDHNKLSRALQTVQRNLPRLKLPDEIKAAGSMSGYLTNLVDTSTAQGGIVRTGSMGSASTIKAGKVVKGKVIREAEEDKEEKVDPGTSIKDQPPEEPEGEVEAGGIQDTEEEPEAPVEKPEPKKAQEETVFQDRLSGQTIKSANIDLKGKGGSVTLELVGAKIPARLSWEPSGKVVFTYKNQPYVLRHG